MSTTKQIILSHEFPEIPDVIFRVIIIIKFINVHVASLSQWDHIMWVPFSLKPPIKLGLAHPAGRLTLNHQPKSAWTGFLISHRHRSRQNKRQSIFNF